MKRLLLSIVVPVYNCESKIEKCVESILSQSFEDFELILVNDGSQDDSGRICERYSQIDSRVKVIHKENGGVSSARNFGIRESKGKYLLFVDCGDYLDINACETMVNKINNKDLLISGFKRVCGKRITRVIYNAKQYESMKSLTDDFNDLYESYAFNSPWNKLYVRNLITDMFDESMSFGEDFVFNLNYMKKCKNIRIINECLYNYVIEDDESLSLRYNEDLIKQSVYMYDMTANFFREYLDEKKDTNSINVMFLRNIIGAVQKMIFTSKYDKNKILETLQMWCIDKTIIEKIYNIQTNDKQMKFLCFLLIKRKVNLLYYYFRFKKFAIQRVSLLRT